MQKFDFFIEKAELFLNSVDWLNLWENLRILLFPVSGYSIDNHDFAYFCTVFIWFVLVFFAFKHFRSLIRKFNFERILFGLCKSLEKEKELSFEKVSEEVLYLREHKNIKCFSKAWEDFYSNLKQENENEFIATKPIDVFFDAEVCTKCYDKFPFNLDASFSFYVSLGIFGTFLGIVLGLKGLQFDFQNIERSIEPLLSGIYLSFRTSIWGISLSSVLGWLSSGLDKRIYTNFIRLQHLLGPENLGYRTLTIHSMIYSLKDILCCQLDQIKHLNTELTDKFPEQMQNVFQPMISTFKEDMEEINRKNTDLLVRTLSEIEKTVNQSQTDSMGQIVDGFMDQMNSSMGDMFQEMSETMKKNIGVIESMQSNIQNISGQLENSGDKLQLIFDSTGKQAENLDDATKVLIEKGSEFAGTIDTINEYQKGICDMMQEMKDFRHKENTEHEARFKDLREAEKAHFQSINSQNEILEKLLSISNNIVNYASKYSEIGEQLIGNSEKQEKISNALSSSVKESLEGFKKISDVSKELNSFSESLKVEFEKLFSISEKFGRSVDLGNESIVKLDSWAKDLREVVNSIDSTSISMRELYENNKYLVVNTKENFQELEKNIKNILNNLPESLKLSFQSFDEEMSKIGGFMSQAVQSFEGAVDEFSEIDDRIIKIMQNIELYLKNNRVSSEGRRQ